MADYSELENLSALIDLIYRGATNPEHWDITLAALSDYMQAPHGFLLTPMHSSEKGGYFFSQNIPAGVIENWPRFIPHDIYAQEAMARGSFDQSGTIVIGEELIPREQFEKSIFFRDYLSRYDLGYMMAAVVFGKDAPDLLPTTCTYYRGMNDEAFSNEERRKLQLVIPHISRALGVMQRLKDADLKVAASRSTLDLLKVGIILVDRDKNVVFANKSAIHLLKESDGLRIWRNVGVRSVDKLVASGQNTQYEIDSALSMAIKPDILSTPHFAQSVTVSRPSNRASYKLSFSSLPNDNEFGTGDEIPRAIVFITNPELPINLDTEWLIKTYGLTNAEARTALMMLNGDSTEDIAESLCVSANTINTQLQQIYSKTGVRNRAKLVRLLISLSDP